jgi:hypothetical protein
MMARYRQRRNAPRRWWVIGSAVTVAGILGYAQFISPVLEGSPESETVTEQVAGNAAGPRAPTRRAPARRHPHPRITR